MKKGILFLILSVLTLGAWADTYTPVEYIATTTSMKDGDSNDNVPYINTGYVHKANTKIEMECAITAEQKNWEALFGTRNGDGNTTNGAFVFFWRTNGSNVGCYNRGDGEKAGSNSIPKDVRIKVLANPGSVTIKKVSDNSDVTTISTPEAKASVGASHKPIYIFDTNTTSSEGLHPDGSRSYMKLYNFRIYEGDDLVHYYVPVKRDSDNKPGLYDLKTGSFVTSATSKDFDASTTVQTFTTWSTGDAILPSIKYGGSYSAYTWAKDLGHGWADANFNQIAGTPAEISGKKWYETDYAPSSEWQLGNSVLPNSWSSNMGDIYVRRQFIIANNASLPSTVYMPAPHDDAPCEYYINGTRVWSRTGDELAIGDDATEKYGKANGWYEGEVVRLTDAQKALIKTDGTVNVFAFHVHQNWGGHYADGGLYGDAGTAGSPSKQFTDNYPAIDALIALCEAENTTNDASFQTAIDNAKAHQNMLQNTTNRFNDLVIARKRYLAERRSEAFVGSAPEAGKDYYLYNVGQRQFLGGGNDWGTTLSLVYASNAMTLEADGNKFKINSHRVIYGRNVGYVSSNGYIDSEQPASFTFSETSSGSKTYTISYESGKYLGYKASTYNRVVVDNTDASSTDNHWKLISKAEFDELQNKATVSAPVDATYLISNPGYERGMARGDWTYVGCSTEGLNDNYQNDTNYPDYVVTGNDGGEISVSRTLTGLKPGIYKVSVQACYRDGWNAACAWNHYNGTQHRNAKLIAGNKVADIKTLAECGGKVPGITTNLDNASLEAIIGGFPDTGPEAAEFFEVGQFWTSVDNVLVGSDGQLTIAVKRESGDHIDGDWLAVDNWRLTYYGPNIASGEDYYLYNVGSELWLQDNNRKPSEWTTRAELGDRGMNVGVSAISGGYKLDPYFGNNHSLNGGEGLLYMDTTQPVTAWTISSVPGTDYVTIKSGDNFLGSDGSANKYLTVSSSLSGENAYWKMYTADEYYNVRKTEMLTATQASPKDATWMIKDPKFGYKDERESNWAKVFTGGNNDLDGDDTGDDGRKGVHCNCVWESWNASSHSLTQTLEILPAGVYRMSVQGFYNSNSSNQLPYYFVENSTSGMVQNYIMLASEGEHESTGGCATSAVLGGGDGQFWASKCIYEGHYQNPWIYFIVGSDNEATTIGVKKEGQNGEDWLVYDNFKLEYLGLDYEISFNENNTSIEELNRLATRVTMTRSMQNDGWNTFCVPFAMTGSQITEQFGSGSQVKELSGAVKNGENYTMTFTDADDIVAGKPYMVKPANNVSSIELTDANGIAVNTTGTPSVTKDGVTFTGVYTNGLAPRESFIISNNVFYLVDSDVTLKAFRGYITTASGSNVKALDFTFDDDATGISDLKDSKDLNDSKVIYNVAGQRLDNSQFTIHNSQLKRGIYIVNGKKIMVK